MSAYDGRGSVTEASNQMTENIDVASPLGMYLNFNTKKNL